MRRHPLDLLGAALAALLLAAPAGWAQVPTGSVAGTVSDTSGSVLPGAAVSVSGERLIGGTQTVVTGANGTYRFDRLPPGSYDLKFELSGFKTVDRREIRLNAGFTATINAQLEVGDLTETITVVGESPTVDTKSGVQQIIMGQEFLENVPTGRDPWALAKIIPGVQVATYDVGGTQGMQQSAVSARGSASGDVVYAVDGLNTNWPGGAGGAVAMYYDQGMFEEVNYQTAALPAEVAVGGVYINMVTKEGGNRLRGDVKFFFANDALQSENHEKPELEQFGFSGGNPLEKLWDFNASAGGPIIRDSLWWHASFRSWKVDKRLIGGVNPDGSLPIDDNLIRNYSLKLSWQMARSHKLSLIGNFDEKFRYHRRDVPPAFVPDIATQRQQTNHVQAGPRYTAVLGGDIVFESGFSFRNGTGSFGYQDGVGPDDIRIEDPVRSTADVAGPTHQLRPNGRTQFDNILSWSPPGRWGAHLLKFGAQYAKQSFETIDRINGDMYIIFRDGVPNSVRIFNTPTQAISYTRQLGLFAQDSWTLNRFTLNLGGRFDTVRGWWPDQDVPAGSFIGARHLDEETVVRQKVFTWRASAVFDVRGNGKTALKVGFSRYASQVGIDRVTSIHPLVNASGTRSWTDRNGDGVPQEGELGAFSGFAEVNRRYASADGPDWPYADEFMVSLDHELTKDLRVGAAYFHRTNRKQVGFRNVAVPSTAYTEFSAAVPDSPTGPGGTTPFYNLDRAYFGVQENVYDNQSPLDTEYDGVEFTASKRLSDRWQLFAGLTLGKNVGGLTTGDLNDPNNLINQQGRVGNDSEYSVKVSGTYMAPLDIQIGASLLVNNGYPYQSTYAVTRSVFPGLTRASQLVRLTPRGEERFENVTMLDLRFSRPFRFGGTWRITPLVELFNLTNTSSIVSLTAAVGSRYLAPQEIVAPRIVRVGFRLEF